MIPFKMADTIVKQINELILNKLRLNKIYRPNLDEEGNQTEVNINYLSHDLQHQSDVSQCHIQYLIFRLQLPFVISGNNNIFKIVNVLKSE